MQRKGDVAVTTIILVAIAILVLVVVAALLLRQYSRASQTITQCAGGIGQCDNDCDTSKYIKSVDPQCIEGGKKYCCVPRTKLPGNSNPGQGGAGGSGTGGSSGGSQGGTGTGGYPGGASSSGP